MGTVFLEHLLFAKHHAMCFVLFDLKRIVEPKRYYVTDEKIGQRESWSPDLYLNLGNLETHSSFHRGYGGRQKIQIPHSEISQGRQTFSFNSETSNRAPEAAFKSHVASWIDCLGSRTETATLSRGHFRHTDMIE